MYGSGLAQRSVGSAMGGKRMAFQPCIQYVFRILGDSRDAKLKFSFRFLENYRAQL